MTDAANGPSRAAAVGWSVAHLVGGLILAGALLYLVSRGWGPAALATEGGPTLFMQGVVQVIAYGGLTWLIGRKVLKLGWDDLRVAVPGRARGFALGLVGAAGLALLAMTLAVPLAGARWSPDGGGFGEWLRTAVATAAMLAPAALSEELMFRGLPAVLLARAFGLAPAIVVPSVVFGLLHGANPSVTQLALGNIALAGVFLALAFFAPGGLWTAWGAHLGWNATLAAAAAPVSGLPFSIPLIDYDPGAPAWLSGGAFGPEGGLLATAVLLLGCTLLGRAARRKDDLA